ncbi:flagellar assembly protein FliH [Anaerobacillus alkaliphilus]|uniref:flagellar assembly protein FliH n=1 Tax=Anaerobacillus alkaliphilus TaxID=1548597 RepID=UPI0013761377|nr:flagellar assembly protein FliH [Anaerobacillus alkaliphilus]
MSRVIKSFFANNLETEKKTIGIKKVTQESQGSNLIEFENQPSSSDQSKLVDEEIQKAMEQAEQIRKVAQAEYEDLQQRINDEMIAVQRQAEDLYRQAEENGYNEGFQQGLKEGQKQYETFIQDARNIIDASKNDYFHKLEEAEPIIIDLSVKVAEKILATTLELDREQWLSVVSSVINEVREHDLVKLYVHPQWFEYTLTHKEELKILLPNCDSFYIYPDAQLEENGCQVETAFGKIDASIDSQLTEIKYALHEKLKGLSDYEGR